MDSSYDDQRQEASRAESPQKNEMGKKRIDRVCEKLCAGHDSIRTEESCLHRLGRSSISFRAARVLRSAAPGALQRRGAVARADVPWECPVRAGLMDFPFLSPFWLRTWAARACGICWSEANRRPVSTLRSNRVYERTPAARRKV